MRSKRSYSSTRKNTLGRRLIAGRPGDTSPSPPAIYVRQVIQAIVTQVVLTSACPVEHDEKSGRAHFLI
jgi:hypothetical protein